MRNFRYKMGWVNIKERLPVKMGDYNVIKFIEGTSLPFFTSIVPSKSIQYMQYKESMRFKENFNDTCIFIQYKPFFSRDGLEQDINSILYWYELDPIPADEDIPNDYKSE